MYNKFYEFIVPNFDDVELSTTDTDSFLFSCKIPKGESVANLLKKHEDHFDFSNFQQYNRHLTLFWDNQSVKIMQTRGLRSYWNLQKEKK